LEYILWKIKTLRRFDNTIAHWSKPVRQFLRNLPTRGAFLAAFMSEKRWDDNQKKFSNPYTM
jgi:hypothetical protein